MVFEVVVKLAAVLENGTVVAWPTITMVVPSITVVDPDTENLGSTGMVFRPSITKLVIPLITVSLVGRAVTCAPGSAIVVGCGITRNGVPLIVVVIPPLMPDARERGILVADGNIRTGSPFTVEIIAPGMFAGEVGI